MVRKVRKISCQKCGVCAKTQRGLKLTSNEVAAITGKVNLTGTGQREKPGRLPIDSKHMCVAFTTKEGKGHCRIYPVRPGICRQYPVIYFQGRAIIQKDCTAVRKLLADGVSRLSRTELKKIPFLAKSIKALEAEFPQVKEQKFFDITNA